MCRNEEAIRELICEVNDGVKARMLETLTPIIWAKAKELPADVSDEVWKSFVGGCVTAFYEVQNKALDVVKESMLDELSEKIKVNAENLHGKQ